MLLPCCGGASGLGVVERFACLAVRGLRRVLRAVDGDGEVVQRSCTDVTEYLVRLDLRVQSVLVVYKSPASAYRTR